MFNIRFHAGPRVARVVLPAQVSDAHDEPRRGRYQTRQRQPRRGRRRRRRHCFRAADLATKTREEKFRAASSKPRFYLFLLLFFLLQNILLSVADVPSCRRLRSPRLPRVHSRQKGTQSATASGLRSKKFIFPCASWIYSRTTLAENLRWRAASSPRRKPTPRFLLSRSISFYLSLSLALHPSLPFAKISTRVYRRACVAFFLN